jgi:hypothetical protein
MVGVRGKQRRRVGGSFPCSWRRRRRRRRRRRTWA